MSEQLALFIDFENVAIWAEQEFFDFELTDLMEYLQSRGPVVIKRAYADWTRFSRYRDDMLNNSIDLIQLYNVRAGKNRADIRMALDAFETAVTREQIQTIVLVSGDSDFGPLVSKLREYGRYVLGIGPRSITHPLLSNSCDEFVYLETVIGEAAEPEDAYSDRERASELLRKALAVFGQRGELPVLATKLKQTMLNMDSTFNEANLGYRQFSEWLEDNADEVKIFFKELQLFVTPADFATPNGIKVIRDKSTAVGDGRAAHKPDLPSQYRRVFGKTISVDWRTRRDVLRDIYRELSTRPGEQTADALLESLQQRYEAQALARSRSTLLKVWQIGFRQRAYKYLGQSISFHTPVRLADSIDSEATFICRAESEFAYAIIKTGLPVDHAELAAVLLDDREQTEYIQTLINDLFQRHLIVRRGDEYRIPGQDSISFRDDPHLLVIIQDILEIDMPEGMPTGADSAHLHARKAMLQRSQDFAAATLSYLLACRLQWDAVEKQESGARLDDLRWMLASYASTKAGELSHVQHDYVGARPYYLAFFSLVQEDDPLWERVRGLINPMLSYYWLNLGRERHITLASNKTPAKIAAQAALHPELRDHWLEATQALADVNPGLLERVASQIKLIQNEIPESLQIAELIEKMLES